MKIIYIVWSLANVAPIKILLNIVKHLNKNITPIVLTIAKEKENSLINSFQTLNIQVQNLNFKKITDIFKIIYNIKNVVQNIKPDIIVSQCFYSNLLNVLLLSSYPQKTTIIHCDYDEDFKMCYGKIKGWITSRIFDFLLSKIPHRYACSKQLSILLNNKKKFNVDYINNGIDIEKFFPTTNKYELRRKLNLPEDKNIFIWSALHLPVKNPFLLTQVINKTKNKDIFFVICGNGPLEDKIKEQLKNCTNVKLTGNVKNIDEYLRAADYYISTSLSEGLPLSVLEGMASGLPVILSNIPQHKILFEQGYEIGLTFEPYNAEQLFNCIFNILEKDKEALKNNCIELISQNFTAQIMSRKYQEEYKKILGAEIDV